MNPERILSDKFIREHSASLKDIVASLIDWAMTHHAEIRGHRALTGTADNH